MSKPNSTKRRDFLKFGALAGMGISMASSRCQAQHSGQALSLFKVEPIKNVRVGFVGVGGRGSSHVRNFLKLEGVEIKAVCDIVESKVERIQQWVSEAGQAKPAGYSKGEYDFKRLCEEQELDLIIDSTPWRWHVPVCVAAMSNDKHAATEVPAAITLDDCWKLVEFAEKYQKFCIMLENCCYDWPELLVLNMARKGVMGEIIHGEVGYLHDLRALKFSDEGEGLWRLDHSVNRNGNLYPTHGLGPLAQVMDVNRGDCFDYLVSMSSPALGLREFADKNLETSNPKFRLTFKNGDVNTSLIKTKKGKTIVLTHNTNSPRPYSRYNLVQGTRGIFNGYPSRIYLEGISPQSDTWDPLENYTDEYEHPLWKRLKEQAKGGGHGGMDYIMAHRLIYCLQNGLPMDMDVYDAAAWSAVSALSEKSVADKSRPVDFPDFTRGQWKSTPPLGIVSI
ncbi:Gfo/Idh/MocA family oxidoreductase [candidate division KSB1 bacterium]|nr:Gfo/Idh/MocA family oxidoreductase [candidate division KSB1 bacterium]